MDMEKYTLQDIFSKNRAEEIGYDVWEHFVVPPFFNRLDLKRAFKPRLIIGGRGCGKTMLLRYLSHQTTFSKKRENIPIEALKHIGMYWRADTQFCNAMHKRGIQDDVWNSAFDHFCALSLGMEVLSSLKSISESQLKDFDSDLVKNIDFSILKHFDPKLPNSTKELYLCLEGKLLEFEAWVENVRTAACPLFLPGKNFILRLIKVIQEKVPVLNNANFYVYIDEYENLAIYQKKIINTWLKHSEIPLIFNLAMKKNAFDMRETTGPESLTNIHDHRIHDLENYLDDTFELFAAEILLLLLSFSDSELLGDDRKSIPIENLRNIESLNLRNDKKYAEKVLGIALQILPDEPMEKLAQEVFIDKALLSKLREKISKAIKVREIDLNIENFVNDAFPMASIIIPALLNRKSLKPVNIANEMNLLLEGKENSFTGKTGWIHNNFVGCLLQLYSPYSRACPIYSGFRTFCKLSRGSVRHFLELCHNSFSEAINLQNEVEIPVKSIQQAEAAKQASATFLGEVRSFGNLGENLHSFVLRLGTLFELANGRSTQSESEISHFSIRKGNEHLTQEDHFFLSEAVKWSVLFEHRETKKKDQILPESIEYILNPIYTPYFHISYRKKRKLELSTSELKKLIRGTLDEFTVLIKDYSKKWQISETSKLPLFSTIDEDRI
jgi:hypothetical protein